MERIGQVGGDVVAMKMTMKVAKTAAMMAADMINSEDDLPAAGCGGMRQVAEADADEYRIFPGP